MVTSLITFFVLYLLPATSLAPNNGNCYYPNGAMSDTQKPCDPDTETSVCCNGKFGYACMENKLCNKGGKWFAELRRTTPGGSYGVSGEDYKDVALPVDAVEAQATPLVEAHPTPLAAEAHTTPLAEMPGDVVSFSSGLFEVPAEMPGEKDSEA
ncbi:hypothetical protein B0H66DRAFT_614492 [Apodospora peruviana]|uniref:Uncharacterized protein n=1 Tax=Apodospora peruviana TaxID=516989 RepID=A0AAE0LXV0_9PEZI|nr:hypothetical protein B0H66DRAFT_614492 [Apodospora peruviana]